jgi:hypothetical protein
LGDRPVLPVAAASVVRPALPSDVAHADLARQNVLYGTCTASGSSVSVLTSFFLCFESVPKIEKSLNTLLSRVFSFVFGIKKCTGISVAIECMSYCFGSTAVTSVHIYPHFSHHSNCHDYIYI